MARARGPLSQRQVASILAGLKGYSHGTIQRIEKLDTVPSDKLRRGQAWVLVTLYGIDPADLDLTDDDRPPFVDPTAIATASDRLTESSSEQGTANFRWGMQATRPSLSRGTHRATTNSRRAA